jgi:hypothetical protein
MPCDVIAACCVGTVFQYCCVTSSHLRWNLVYRLVLRSGLRNLCCVTQQCVDMSQYTGLMFIVSYSKRLLFEPWDRKSPLELRFSCCIIIRGRSEWPRGLRHELSSPAQTLGPWVLIPLEASISVCIVLCEGSAFATGWSPVQGDLPTMYRNKKLQKRPRPNEPY